MEISAKGAPKAHNLFNSPSKDSSQSFVKRHKCKLTAYPAELVIDILEHMRRRLKLGDVFFSGS